MIHSPFIRTASSVVMVLVASASLQSFGMPMIRSLAPTKGRPAPKLQPVPPSQRRPQPPRRPPVAPPDSNRDHKERVDGRNRARDLKRGHTHRRGNESSIQPEGVLIGELISSGLGCPLDTVHMAVAPDNLSFSILFDNYVAQTDEANVRRDVLNCDFIVPIELPQNTQIEITRVDLRGFVDLPLGAQAQLNSLYNFRNDRGVSGTMQLNYVFKGAITEDYELSSDAVNDERNTPTTEVSPCGGKVQLAVRNRLRVVTRRPGESAVITLDSIDGAAESTYFVNWRRCR